MPNPAPQHLQISQQVLLHLKVVVEVVLEMQGQDLSNQNLMQQIMVDLVVEQ
jgi:hypothetical protein